MKRIPTFLLMLFTITAFSQKKDLTTVNTVTPKKGQKMAFEAAYKAHIAKFHKADEKINVFEIITGPKTGTFYLVNNGRSYADFDSERADANAHSLDLDKSFFPYLESTDNATYRFIDSLSLRPEIQAEKLIITVRHLKQSLNQNDYKTELARQAKFFKEMPGAFLENLSYAFYDKQWDGSDQVTVTVRNLKDGFKSLESDYYPAPPSGGPSFRDLYVKAYGYDAWDKRTKLLEDAVTSTEVHLVKFRKDLSSQ
jgi:hypothetical protein